MSALVPTDSMYCHVLLAIVDLLRSFMQHTSKVVLLVGNDIHKEHAFVVATSDCLPYALHENSPTIAAQNLKGKGTGAGDVTLGSPAADTTLQRLQRHTTVFKKDQTAHLQCSSSVKRTSEPLQSLISTITHACSTCYSALTPNRRPRQPLS